MLNSRSVRHRPACGSAPRGSAGHSTSMGRSDAGEVSSSPGQFANHPHRRTLLRPLLHSASLPTTRRLHLNDVVASPFASLYDWRTRRRFKRNRCHHYQ
ncbi:unnamed protein product [Protopolystoma xenopodis]|uniref:Uncharacterized protein n=1 Tax=Protopolystoma xenopodis TaxID=117903 RepID=A0A448XLB9_9PLAT|nr:unnamed protein product [Protopolystoma xenopodis]